MSKLIIYLGGKPIVRGYKIRDFAWSEDHHLYLYMGKEYAPDEFNAAYAQAMKNHSDLGPLVKVVGSAPVAPVVPLAPPPIVSPVATIAPAGEVTVEMAEAVLFRLAPHRLKGKPLKAAESIAV